MVEIREVKTIRDLKRFVDYPTKLYEGNPYFVPAMRMDELNTLRPEKNPAYEFCEAAYFLAYRDRKIVGRIGVILNTRSNDTWNQKRVRFTRMDFIDDAEVFDALFDTVEGWARARGMNEVHGPMGFTDMDQEGMLVEGYEELSTFITLYNHPYYLTHLTRRGYVKDVDWVEYQFEVPDKPNEKVARLASLVERKFGYRLLECKNSKEILPWAHKIFDLLEDAYKKLYGVAPMTKDLVDAYVKQYFGFVNPDFVKLVVDQDDELVAFAITFPSLSRALQKGKGKLFPFGFVHLLRALKKNDRLDLCLVAVKPELQGKGINALLMDAITRSAIKYNMKITESNPELELNEKVQSQWKFYESRQHRRRRCFVKAIS
jgi:GNAT superfamily N-acetyltransferase